MVNARDELRAFLKARRQQLNPQSFGLPVLPSRRARGLTRDEVAELAGVSTGWYAQFELGRPINISSKTLQSIARALRLDRHETRYLFALSGVAPPELSTESAGLIPNGLRFIVEQFTASPVQVLSRRLDVLLTNRAAWLLYNYAADESVNRYNLLLRLLTDPTRRELIQNWDDFVRAMMAGFHHNYASAVGDPWFEDLIARMREESPDFPHFWNEYQVAPAIWTPVKIRLGDLGIADATWSSIPVPESNGLLVAFTVPEDERSASLFRDYYAADLYQNR